MASRRREGSGVGRRRSILNDLSPAATFIAANYNLPFDVNAFAQEARRILERVGRGAWLDVRYAPHGRQDQGCINYTVWSEVFTCPHCSGEVVFLEQALDPLTKGVKAVFPCPHCGAQLKKTNLTRLYETKLDSGLGKQVKHTLRRPVIINYTLGKKKHEKKPDQQDLDLLRRIGNLVFPASFPLVRMMHSSDDVECWGDNWRAGTANISHLHHLFTIRQIHALALLWKIVVSFPDKRLSHSILFLAEQAIWGMSLLN